MGTRARLAVGALLVGLFVAVPIAWATFGDVPPSNPFYNDINAIQGAGITGGCGGGNFCPLDNITRQAEAAFVHRATGRAGYANTAGFVAIPTNQDTVDLAVLTITVGGVPGGTQFVKLDGMVRTATSEDNTVCPCDSSYWIERDGVGAVSVNGFNTNQGRSTSSAPGWPDEETGAVTTVVNVPSGTTQTFRLQAHRYDAPVEGSVVGRGALTAITAPFGSTGASTLAADSSFTGARGLKTGK
jgi:S-layer homology domain